MTEKIADAKFYNIKYLVSSSLVLDVVQAREHENGTTVTILFSRLPEHRY